MGKEASAEKYRGLRLKAVMRFYVTVTELKAAIDQVLSQRPELSDKPGELFRVLTAGKSKSNKTGYLKVRDGEIIGRPSIASRRRNRHSPRIR